MADVLCSRLLTGVCSSDQPSSRACCQRRPGLAACPRALIVSKISAAKKYFRRTEAIQLQQVLVARDQVFGFRCLRTLQNAVICGVFRDHRYFLCRRNLVRKTAYLLPSNSRSLIGKAKLLL